VTPNGHPAEQADRAASDPRIEKRAKPPPVTKCIVAAEALVDSKCKGARARLSIAATREARFA
jgi:hypothetical protein